MPKVSVDAKSKLNTFEIHSLCYTPSSIRSPEEKILPQFDKWIFNVFSKKSPIDKSDSDTFS